MLGTCGCGNLWDKIFPLKADISQTTDKVNCFTEFHQKNVFTTSTEDYLSSPHLLFWLMIQWHRFCFSLQSLHERHIINMWLTKGRPGWALKSLLSISVGFKCKFRVTKPSVAFWPHWHDHSHEKHSGISFLPTLLWVCCVGSWRVCRSTLWRGVPLR